jgi:hypothetical protein
MQMNLLTGSMGMTMVAPCLPPIVVQEVEHCPTCYGADPSATVRMKKRLGHRGGHFGPRVRRKTGISRTRTVPPQSSHIVSGPIQSPPLERLLHVRTECAHVHDATQLPPPDSPWHSPRGRPCLFGTTQPSFPSSPVHLQTGHPHAHGATQSSSTIRPLNLHRGHPPVSPIVHSITGPQLAQSAVEEEPQKPPPPKRPG